MNVLELTSFDEIRTTVGMSSIELSDTTLSSEIYENVLYLALNNITLPTTAPGTGSVYSRFMTIADIATSERTDLQQNFYSLVRVFSTYTLALEVAVSLGMRTPKMESDGKRSLTRFSAESTYLSTIDYIRNALGAARHKLETIGGTDVVTLPWLSVITPAVDVVINE